MSASERPLHLGLPWRRLGFVGLRHCPYEGTSTPVLSWVIATEGRAKGLLEVGRILKGGTNMFYFCEVSSL